MAEHVPADPNADLIAARKRITGITLDIVRLLNERAEAALVVGQAKVAAGAEHVRDIIREGMVVDTAMTVNEGPLSNAAVARVVQVIMNETSALQAETFGLPLGVPLEQGPGFNYSAGQ